MTEQYEGFCVDCGFKVKSFEGLTACPNCESTNNPASYKDHVDISINWHELRILVIWAENYAHAKLGGAGTVYSIAERIAAQHKDREPLTLAGEIGQLQEHFGADNIQTNIPGVEGSKVDEHNQSS